MNSIEIINKINNGEEFNIFDIRAKDRYEFFHIPTAKWMNLGELFATGDKHFSKKEVTWLACNSGNSATAIALRWRTEGYKVEVIENGMSDSLREHLDK